VKTGRGTVYPTTMSDKPTSDRRITKERHDRVTWSGVCPGCGDFRIVTEHKFRGESEDVMDRRRYAGSFLACGGPDSHSCWHMTKNGNAPRLYETFGPKARYAPPPAKDVAAE